MKLAELSTTDFIRDLSGKSPAPGGGSVAAFAGALGSALCAMVARLTLGKGKYRDAWQSMERIKGQADDLSQRFLVLMDKDTEAYKGVVTALRLPKETEQQEITRAEAVQQATFKAASVPLDTLRAVSTLVDLVRTAVEMGNPNCITDVGTAVQLARTAAHAAAYNVQINLADIEDIEFVAECDREVEEILGRLNPIVADLEKRIKQILLRK